MKRKTTLRSFSAVGHKQPAAAAVAVATAAAFPVDLLVLPGACRAPSWETLTPCDTLTPLRASPPPPPSFFRVFPFWSMVDFLPWRVLDQTCNSLQTSGIVDSFQFPFSFFFFFFFFFFFSLFPFYVYNPLGRYRVLRDMLWLY